MPNLLNGLVNGWVKVNNKHVIFLKDDGRRDRKDSDAGASLDESSSSKSRALDRGKSNRTKQSTATTVSTAQSSMDPEALAIKKFNSKRQNKRGLQRTVSHSDLLREMANERGASKSRDAASNNSRMNSYDSNRPLHHDETSRHVAGFFGSDVGGKERNVTEEPRRPSQQKGPVTTGKYLNEDLFVWQMKQSLNDRNSSSSSATGSSAASAPSLGRDKTKRIDSSVQDQELRHSRRETNSRGNGIMRDSLASSLQYQMKDEHRRIKQPSSSSGDSHHHHGVHSPCSGCNKMESQLLAAYDDIRYLRDVSLRSEFSKSPPRPTNSVLGGNNREPSKRLAEITGRHRRQIEQMTRETSRKHHDIHFKHSKMSMISKTLNDESSIRRQDAIILEEEVRVLTLERDKLATEVQRLRTECSLHKQAEQEHDLLKAKMSSYESHSLERAKKAIRERDETIGDLSTQLERALEMLELERERQRQRRQIIFPGAATKPAQPRADDSSVVDVAALQQQLREAKDAAKTSQRLLDASRAEAAKREIALTVRCENLESRLKSTASQEEPR
jgi:hypothetical protein